MDVMPHNGLNPVSGAFGWERTCIITLDPRLRATKPVCAVTDIISHNGLSPVTRASDKQEDVSSLVTYACLARVRRNGYCITSHNGNSPVSGALDEKGDVQSRSTRPWGSPVCAVTNVISHNGLSPVSGASDNKTDALSVLTHAFLKILDSCQMRYWLCPTVQYIGFVVNKYSKETHKVESLSIHSKLILLKVRRWFNKVWQRSPCVLSIQKWLSLPTS